jgi:diketogulonate reductase-like aldo/keto reductase
MNICFREIVIAHASTLTDGVRLHSPCHPAPVILPWVGYGTYRLGKDRVQSATLQAIESGYRAIDTAFIYGGETTETLVGNSIRDAEIRKLCTREELFITTKHWRKYHGYEPTLQCLNLSLRRMKLQYIDLYLMHWPGPAWSTMARSNAVIEQDPWHYATVDKDDMVALRAETWRAMEDACRQGKVRAIGVSNMTIRHLETLKRTATLWPPAVNQVELHPLYPQAELLEYCKKEGIVVQAYSSLGGQDTGQAKWNSLLHGGKSGKGEKMDLLNAGPVQDLARKVHATPAQVLLRWALEQDCPIIPKTNSAKRMEENAGALKARLTSKEVKSLRATLMDQVKANNPDEGDTIDHLTRLAWRRDPLRQLEFE